MKDQKRVMGILGKVTQPKRNPLRSPKPVNEETYRTRIEERANLERQAPKWPKLDS